MPKRFKIKLSKFQLCRSKKSPINPKAPEPPHTTPDHNSTARIAPITLQTLLDNAYISDTESKSGEEEVEEKISQYKLINSPASDISDIEIPIITRLKRWKCIESENNDSLYTSKGFDYPLETISEGKKIVNKLNYFNESVTVVKRSENPNEDFKGSMLEMIVEKKLYSVKHLEQLLQSFLLLNSAQYHGVIVEAFAEVWGDLFGKTPNKYK